MAATITPKIKLQAREIVRNAKRLDINIRRGHTDQCAVSVIYATIKGKGSSFHGLDNREEVAEEIGVNPDKLMAIELGFEGWSIETISEDPGYEHLSKSKVNKLIKSRYYKVGQNAAKLAGLLSRN